MGMRTFSTGTGIDALLGGGVEGGRALLVTGRPGTGKTLIALAYLNEGIVKDEECLYLMFRPVPLRTLLRGARAVARLTPLLDSDQAIFYDMSDPERSPGIEGLPAADRVVMDHPDALSLHGVPDWGWRLAMTINALRDEGAGIIVTTFDERSQMLYICDDVLEMEREEGRMTARHLGWPHPNGRIAREEEAGKWMR
ncbi:MAG: ATPase domain-containing protein [Candidatus Thermoplasmatota archaeon]|nr:ATPase domain-containing protein [Candidatus Thermoplasmatota archaeon]